VGGVFVLAHGPTRVEDGRPISTYTPSGRIVDYERDAQLAGVRTMIRDLEGPGEPNAVILAIQAAFDINREKPGVFARA